MTISKFKYNLYKLMLGIILESIFVICAILNIRQTAFIIAAALCCFAFIFPVSNIPQKQLRKWEKTTFIGTRVSIPGEEIREVV